jgi:uncharacterized protein (TIGR03084 family)
MTDKRAALEQVLADVAAESDELDAIVSDLDDDQWHLETPAEGWTIAHQVAHLAWTDHVATLAATDKEGWDAVVLEAMGDPTGFVDACAQEWSTRPRAELLETWRAGRARLREVLAAHPEGEKVPWFGPPMSPTSMGSARYMETWAHGRDVVDALGILVGPTDRIRHVVHIGTRTRDFAYTVHGRTPPAEPFRFELVAPSGEVWSHGPEDATQQVTGSAYDFCLLVTQRRNPAMLDLVAVGRDATEWMTIAQAFAGPPGSGRPMPGAGR